MGLPLFMDIFRKKTKKQELQELQETCNKNTAISLIVIKELSKEFPNKFKDKIKFKGVVEENVIKLKGNFKINKSEIFKREIEYNGKKEIYKIILTPESGK